MKRMSRKKKQAVDKEENQTQVIFEKIKADLGKNWNRGYSTSEGESSEDEADIEQREEDMLDEDDGDNNKALDKEEREQQRLEEAIKERKYILSARNNTRFYWDIVVIVFAVQNALILPLEISFSEVV